MNLKKVSRDFVPQDPPLPRFSKKTDPDAWPIVPAPQAQLTGSYATRHGFEFNSVQSQNQFLQITPHMGLLLSLTCTRARKYQLQVRRPGDEHWTWLIPRTLLGTVTAVGMRIPFTDTPKTAGIHEYRLTCFGHRGPDNEVKQSVSTLTVEVVDIDLDIEVQSQRNGKTHRSKSGVIELKEKELASLRYWASPVSLIWYIKLEYRLYNAEGKPITSWQNNGRHFPKASDSAEGKKVFEEVRQIWPDKEQRTVVYRVQAVTKARDAQVIFRRVKVKVNSDSSDTQNRPKRAIPYFHDQGQEESFFEIPRTLPSHEEAEKKENFKANNRWKPFGNPI